MWEPIEKMVVARRSRTTTASLSVGALCVFLGYDAVSFVVSGKSEHREAQLRASAAAAATRESLDVSPANVPDFGDDVFLVSHSIASRLSAMGVAIGLAIAIGTTMVSPVLAATDASGVVPEQLLSKEEAIATQLKMDAEMSPIQRMQNVLLEARLLNLDATLKAEIKAKEDGKCPKLLEGQEQELVSSKGMDIFGSSLKKVQDLVVSK